MKQGLLALLAITLLLGGVYALGRSHGASETEAAYTSEINQQAAAQAEALRMARIESRDALAKKDDELQQQLVESDQQLRELLESNNEFNAWYQARAPTAVGDVIYNLKRMQ